MVAITSKIVAIHQGRCVSMAQVGDKDKLIEQEADLFLPRDLVPHQWALLTIKDGTLLPTAGIDESNANGYYILMPHDPDKFAQEMWLFLRQEFKVKELGVIITDSRTVPMRWGVSGVSLGYYGFDPLADYRGTPDIFGRKMKISMANVVDALAVGAVYLMGEGSETQPLVLIEDLPQVKFEESPTHRQMLKVDSENDLFAPLINSVPWKKGGGGGS